MICRFLKKFKAMLGYSNICSVVHVDFSERSVELMWRGSSSDFRECGYQDCIECASLISSGCGDLLRSTFKVFIAGSKEPISESQFESISSDVEISAFVECIYSAVRACALRARAQITNAKRQSLRVAGSDLSKPFRHKSNSDEFDFSA